MAQVEGSGTAATPKEKLSIVGYGPWSRLTDPGWPNIYSRYQHDRGVRRLQILDRKGGKWNRRYCAKEQRSSRFQSQ